MYNKLNKRESKPMPMPIKQGDSHFLLLLAVLFLSTMETDFETSFNGDNRQKRKDSQDVTVIQIFRLGLIYISTA